VKYDQPLKLIPLRDLEKVLAKIVPPVLPKKEQKKRSPALKQKRLK
jgi:hypothetical protein